MICFKDMTFCVAKCLNGGCKKNWELRDKRDYKEWSKAFTGDGPVAFCDFSSDCKDYDASPE